jgi:hypothetical protein
MDIISKFILIPGCNKINNNKKKGPRHSWVTMLQAGKHGIDC